MRRAGFNNKGFKQCYTSASACWGLHQSPSPRGSLVTHQVCFEFQTWFSDFIGLLRKKDTWIQENSGIVGDWEWLFTNNKMSGNLKVRLVHCPALAPDGTERIWKWGIQRGVNAWQTEKCAWLGRLSQTQNTTNTSRGEATPRDSDSHGPSPPLQPNLKAASGSDQKQAWGWGGGGVGASSSWRAAPPPPTQRKMWLNHRGPSQTPGETLLCITAYGSVFPSFPLPLTLALINTHCLQC